VLDAICYHATRRVDLDDGRIKLLVDPAKVRRSCGIGGEQLEKLARELREATIQVKEPVELACIGGLIDHIDTAVRGDGTPITRYDPLTGGQRHLWRVELGKAFCRLIHKDVWLGFDPAPLARIKHGISQAIARHVMTHEHQPRGGWMLDGLIQAVAGELGDVATRHRRRELRADIAQLEKMGIVLEGNRIKRRVQQTPDSVQQMPDRVQQTPGACSKRPELAGTDSGHESGVGAT